MLKSLAALALFALPIQAQAGCPTVVDIDPFDLDPIYVGSTPRNLTVEAGTRVFFEANDGVHGRELWMRAASGATGLVLDVNPNGDGEAHGIHPHWDGSAWRTYFLADDGVHGRELWVTDGTAAGTHMVIDLLPGPGDGVLFPELGLLEGDLLGSFEGEVYFAGRRDLAEGFELFATDGTAAGTRLVAELVPGAGNSKPNRFVEHRGQLHFVVVLDTTGFDSLWRTDGQTAELIVPSFVTLPGFRELTSLGDVLFFRGTYFIDSKGIELLALMPDGSVRLVADHWPGGGSGSPEHLTVFDGRLVYTARSGDQSELMVVDPVTLAPEVVSTLDEKARFIAAGDQYLYFGARVVSAGQRVIGRWDGSGPIESAGSPILLFWNFGTAVTVGDDLFVEANDLITLARDLYHVDAETGVLGKACGQLGVGTNPAGLALVSGALVYSGAAPGVGQELMVLDLVSAQALDLGPPGSALSLAATAPHLAGTTALTLAGTTPGEPAVLAWSLATPAYASPLVQPLGAGWLDPASLQLVQVFAANGSDTVVAGVPATPGLAGLTVHAQGLELVAGSFPARASNGVALTLGL